MTKLVVPPMPSLARLAITTDNFGLIALARIIDHDQEGWQTAQREAALADDLAEALERIRRNQSCADPDCCSQARAHEKALEKA